jgi:hypothetical protein
MNSNRFVGYSLSLNCRSTVVSTQQRPGELEWMNAFNGRVLLWIQFHAPDRPARCQAIGLRPEATTPSRAYTGGPPLTRFSLHEARKLKRCAGPGEPACLCMSDFQVPPRRIHNNSQGPSRPSLIQIFEFCRASQLSTGAEQTHPFCCQSLRQKPRPGVGCPLSFVRRPVLLCFAPSPFHSSES